jgi:integrase
MADFSFFKRDSQNKGMTRTIWYVRFRESDGSWSTPKSTGETTKKAAEEWAEKEWAKRQVEVPGSHTPLKDFAAGFFEWESPWAIDKRTTGKRISRQRCIEYQRLYEKYVVPEFGDLPLSEITKHRLKDWRNKAYTEKTLSGSGVNKVLMLVNFILIDADDKDLISFVPRVERVSQKPEKHKGMLTIEEARAVLNPAIWEDRRAYTMSLLAASTGMRLGEVQALRIKNYHVHYIEVSQSWNEHLKELNESTKTGRARNIIIPAGVRMAIESLIDENPWRSAKGEDAFIFYNTENDHRPAHGSFMTRCLFRAINAASIPEAERKERNITFHSWRYFLNSMLINAKIPLQKVQSVTGHLTAEMSQHYFNLDVNEMSDICKFRKVFWKRREAKVR